MMLSRRMTRSHFDIHGSQPKPPLQRGIRIPLYFLTREGEHRLVEGERRRPGEVVGAASEALDDEGFSGFGWELVFFAIGFSPNFSIQVDPAAVLGTHGDRKIATTQRTGHQNSFSSKPWCRQTWRARRLKLAPCDTSSRAPCWCS